jgi:putative restriction endonuclease
MERRNWTRDQLIIAFNLYCKTAFGRIHNRNPEIISLAKALGRSPSALSWKLANFARLDPSLKKRDILGATHGGKLEQEVWDEFSEDWERLSYESETLCAELTGQEPPQQEDGSFPEGTTRESLVRIRVNQGFFRAAVLAAYDSTCCVTGLKVGELLCASHIVPWSVDKKNRTNPRNGLCLNALHDRAFDRGLFTVDLNYEIQISPRLASRVDSPIDSLIMKYAGKKISIPAHFEPAVAFLNYHRENIFQRTG